MQQAEAEETEESSMGWGCQAGGDGDNLMGMVWGRIQTGGDGVGMGMNFITVSFSRMCRGDVRRQASRDSRCSHAEDSITDCFQSGAPDD